MCYEGDVSVLVRMEQTVLKVLNFQVQVADPIFFLDRLMLYDENGECEQYYNTCTYCMDSILHDVSSVEILPSEMASSAVLAARLIDDRLDWPKPLGYATGHWPSTNKLRPLALKMILAIAKVADDSSPFAGATNKYASQSRFNGLSTSPKFDGDHLRNIIQLLSS